MMTKLVVMPWVKKKARKMNNLTQEQQNLINMTREDFDHMMVKSFPVLFKYRHYPMTETCMCWGFEIGPGWFPVVFNLCRNLDLISRLSGVEIIAEQVKEKFATLRFYYEVVVPENTILLADDIKTVQDVVSVLVHQAEDRTSNTCETCGQEGKQHSISGWLKTLCPTHAQERKQLIQSRQV